MAQETSPQEKLADIKRQAETIQAGISGLATKEAAPVDAATIQGKILEEGGVISSEETGAEKLFTESISGLKKAAETTGKGIEASFERQRIATEEAGRAAITSTEERRRGFATNAALIKQMEKDLQTSLRDLDLRETEALAAGQNEIAGKIANLKLQQIEFTMNAKQRAFDNALRLRADKRAEEGEALTRFKQNIDIYSSANSGKKFSELPQDVQEEILSTGKIAGMSDTAVIAAYDAKSTNINLEFREIGGSLVSVDKNTGKVSVIASPNKPLSLTEIEQFRRSYGWTPPLGFTQQQLQQFIKDNPNATPEELEAGARLALIERQGSGETGENFLDKSYFINNFTTDELKSLSDKAGTSRWWTPKGMDINRFLDDVLTKIDEARIQGYSDSEILEYLTGK